jgi:hypothetical protein
MTMKRWMPALCAALLTLGITAGSATASDKYPVEILGQSDLAPIGEFEVYGAAAEMLCPTGTIESGDTRIKWLDDDTFKIWQDKYLTCDTGEMFVLELKNTIVIGEGGVPGKGTWRLHESTGFDLDPKGKGDIVVVESPAGVFREAYVGLLMFK